MKRTSKKGKDTADRQLAEIIVRGMQEKKAFDITLVDLRNVKNAVSSFFVICSANSNTQLGAIMDGVEEQVYKELKTLAWQREGTETSGWMLLDYASAVAHVFIKDRRRFYGLEDLWGDAEITTYPNS